MEVTSEHQRLLGSTYYHCSVCKLTFGNQTAFDSHKPRCIGQLQSASSHAGNWAQDCIIPVCQIKQEVALEDDGYEGQNSEEQPEEEDFLYFCASCNNVYETKHEFRLHKPNCKKGLDKMHVEDGPDDNMPVIRKKGLDDSVVGSSNDMVSEAVTSVFICSGCPKMFSTAQDLMKHERESFHKKPPIAQQPDSTVQVAYPLPNIKQEPIEDMDITDELGSESCTCTQCHIQFSNLQELENHRSICNIEGTSPFGQENAILPPEFIKVEPTDSVQDEFQAAPQLLTSDYIFSCPRCQIKFRTKIELEDHNKICFLRDAPCATIEMQQPVSLNVVPAIQIKQEPDLSIEEHPIDEIAADEDSILPTQIARRGRRPNTSEPKNTENVRKNTADLESKGMHPCNNCHLTFADKSFLDKHASHCSGSKMSLAISEFSCNWCSRSFSGARFLEKHMPMHFDKFCAEEKPFICDYCNKDFDRKELLVTHIFQHMRNMKNYASKESVGVGNLQQNRQSRNKDLAAELAEDFASFRSPKTGLYECKKCPSRYNQPKTLSDHLLVHRENGLFRCSVCPKRVFLTAELLEKHTNEKHKRNSLKCQYCGLQQENDEALQKHLAVHSNALPFQCKYCGEGFSRTTYLNTHCQTKHPEYFPHHCDQCPMVFRQESTLIQHKKVHRNATVDTFTCNVCGQTFVNQQLLGVHKRKHSSESQSHTCQVCGLVFKFESTLKVHLTKHNISNNPSPTVNLSDGNNKTGAERTWYTCGVCGQIYLTENGLLSHSLKVHNTDPHKKDQSTSNVNVKDTSNKDGRIWHTCKDCHRIFLTENGLVAHCQKMHGVKSDDSLFCGICSAKFFSEEDMEIHMSAHTK